MADDVLNARDTVRPIHKPDELWTRCPCCEPSGPNRLRLTIAGDTLSCREGCEPERIREALER